MRKFILFLLLVCVSCQSKPDTSYDFQNLTDKISYSVGYNSRDINYEIEKLKLNKELLIAGFYDGLNNKERMDISEKFDYEMAFAHVALNKNFIEEKFNAKKEKIEEKPLDTKLTLEELKKSIEESKRANKELEKDFEAIDNDLEIKEWNEQFKKWKDGTLKYEEKPKELIARKYEAGGELKIENVSDGISYVLGYHEGNHSRRMIQGLRLSSDMVMSGFLDKLKSTPQLKERDLRKFHSAAMRTYLSKDVMHNLLTSEINEATKETMKSVEDLFKDDAENKDSEFEINKDDSPEEIKRKMEEQSKKWKEQSKKWEEERKLSEKRKKDIEEWEKQFGIEKSDR